MSNLPGQRDVTALGAQRTTHNHLNDVTIRPAIGDEVHAALRLILSSGLRRASESEVVDFLSFAVHRRIDLNALWVAVRGGRIVFASLPVPSPGRTMLLLSPPIVPDRELDTSAPALVAEIIIHYANRGVQLAQALVDPDHVAAVRLYERCGFQSLAELIYLNRDLRGGRASWPQLPAEFSWETYSDATHARFAKAVSASYQGSLDCPALNGVRDVEDVLAGHKAAGEFDPGLWFLLVERPHGAAPSAPGVARGALLLSRSSRGDALELIYLGLAPPARGRGLGDVMMQQALAAATATGTGGISLAVDARNTPALKLYYRYGMQRVASRIAFMRDLRELRNTSAPGAAVGAAATAGNVGR